MRIEDLHEECGILALQQSSITMCAFGLHALQHRGQEAFGIVSFNAGGDIVRHVRGKGYVSSFFTEQVDDSVLDIVVGHVRYSTSGGSKDGTQPIMFTYRGRSAAIAHNGNITNASYLTDELVRLGCVFSTDIDTEIIANMMMLDQSRDFLSVLLSVLLKVEGAYSIVIAYDGMVIGIRDALGIRPLVLGKTCDGYVLASESCAFQVLNAEFVRDVAPGELLVIKGKEVTSSHALFSNIGKKFCIFEYVYFSRADSFCEGQFVYEVRKRIGEQLACEHPTVDTGDVVVVPTPDSSIPVAIGYSRACQLPMELGLIRNNYTGRTFIQPSESKRMQASRLKYGINKSVVNGKNVVLMDDSLVRGITLLNVVQALRANGAKSIHVKISSPPVKYSCFYGIDTPDPSALLARLIANEDLATYLNADSVDYLSIDGLKKAVGGTGYCDACFTGDYPIKCKAQ